ncbi:MAG: shikimate kinase [Lactobacillales bacterium]|jgi:shikimate kinase|nr:shikimate kinase [Lactobacillales bacterium]
MSIILIGFMGSGKSSVAEALGLPVADMDVLIAQKAGKSIPEIFAEDGEKHFRELETAVLSEVSDFDGVVATGGGVITTEASRAILKKQKNVFFLKADIQNLYERIKNDTENVRPIAQNNDFGGLYDVYKKRENWYNEAASYVIETDEMTACEVAAAIKEIVC